ncbi:MAG: hypothetical protein ACK5VI_05010 [Opitutia bacterium]
MERPAIPPDPALAALAALAGTEGAMRRMSWLAVAGLAFWMLVLLVLGLMLSQASVKKGEFSLGMAAFNWSILGVPVLLHIWPIANLRRAAKALAVFASAPSEAGAAGALRAQRLYWRAAGISHLIIVLWFIVLAALWFAN